MANPSQKFLASSKAYNQDLKDMDNLCTFKTKIKRQNLKHWSVKDQRPYPNQDQESKPQLGTSSVLQSPNSGFNRHECSLHFQIKTGSCHSCHGCIKDH